MINLITKPSVYLVGQSMITHSDYNDTAMDDFLSDIGTDWETNAQVDDGASLVEVAGRLCYMSYSNPRPGGNKAYINHILEVGHGSVLEHAVFNVILTGISRSCTHELVRHRSGFSYSQLSQRFVNEEECSFVVPPALLDEVALFESWTDGQTSDWAMGREWIESREADQLEYKRTSDYLYEKYKYVEDKTARRKMAREAARSCLPNCTETKIFVTANARAWRHFIEIRSDVAADAEIRRLAIAVLDVLRKASPNIFGDYMVGDNGAAVTSYKKV